jgi:putative salt-induced outer membrane protein YdiY
VRKLKNPNGTAIMHLQLGIRTIGERAAAESSATGRESRITGFLQTAVEALARLFSTSAVGFCLLIVWVQVHANEASSLNFAVNDVFPVTRSELDFTDIPQVLLLAQTSTGSETRQAWESALPPTDKFDWVQTTSGEWLKGELKQLYSGSLEFDSDEFDLQTLDWDDVAQVRAHGTKRISIDTPEGPITVIGEIVITRDKVIVDTVEGTKEFDRSQLISVTPGATSEWDNWSAKIDLGLNFTRGNSDQTEYSMKLNVKRLTPDNRFVVDYLGNITASNDVKSVNNHRLSGFFDIFAAKEYFWRPVLFEYFRDPFQNIDYRTTIGAGGGYHIIDTPKTTWNVSGALGYRATRFVSVQPGDSQKVTTPALIGSTFYDTALTKTIDFNTRYNFSIVNQESGTYTHHAIATVEIELTSILDFDISFVWDRTQDPQTRADGTVPKQDDFQLLFTLGVDI